MLNLLYVTWTGIDQSDIFRQWSFWLQILFCSCVNETTLAPACDHGRSLRRLGRERFATFTWSEYEGYEARHIMAVLGNRNESSIRSYSSQTSLSTTRKMSETLSESLNNKKTVNHSEIPAAESALQPLLTASQEEHIFNELSIEQSNTQKTVNNFYNCSFNFES